MNINKTHKLTIVDKQYQLRKIVQISAPNVIKMTRPSNLSSIHDQTRKAA